MPDDPVLNPQAIESLRDLGADPTGQFLRELIDIFIEDTPLRLAEIDQALAKSDAATLTRAAHTIKGSSSNFGATRLARVAQEIEAYGKSANFAAAAAANDKLKAEHVLVVQALKQIAQGT